ncbi:DNA polymerase Y family protein [Pontixanthobacter rizhaonensis]|uniref:Y-family DNA polymerase n=1 Tax=Pontixanthobacter rizhaonensis TaxID=2730337 RepID=UPI0031B5842A
MEKQKGAVRLAAINPLAGDEGLAAGMTLADARAMVPELQIYNSDPAADEDFLDRLADGCTRYTPNVAVYPPDIIIMDIGGSAHLSGGERKLSRSVKEYLGRRQITVRIGLASTTDAARALAEFSSGHHNSEMCAIEALPVAALRLDAEGDLGLRRAGLQTIGEVASRPRSAIAARFGTRAVFALEKLIGAAESPLNPRRHEIPWVFERRFPEPIASKVYALKVLHGLLEEAKIRLIEEDRGGRHFEASFHRVDGRVQYVQVETGLPSRDTKAITRLFDERLDTLADPLDPGFGFDSVGLRILRTDPLKPHQSQLEKEAREEDNSAEFLDRLAVRLGRNRLLTFRSRDTHIPEKSQVASAAIHDTTQHNWTAATQAEPPVRPLQLFDPPHPITVIAEIPDGPPKRFRWHGKSRDVTRFEGPERIASEWWLGGDDPLGAGQWTRDYFRIEDTSGRRYWVFRYGLYGRETSDPQWYLHGLFA